MEGQPILVLPETVSIKPYNITARLILRKKMTLRDTNTTTTDKSRAVTMDSCFVLIGTRLHVISHLLSESRVATPRVPESNEAKIVTVVSRKENVDRQNHLNILTHGQNHATRRHSTSDL